MLIYDIYFIDNDGRIDGTQLDVEKSSPEEERIELINLILSLKEEMNIKEILEVVFVGEEELSEI